MASLMGGRIPPIAMQSASNLCLHIPTDGELTTTLRGLFYCGTALVLGKALYVLSPKL